MLKGARVPAYLRQLPARSLARRARLATQGQNLVLRPGALLPAIVTIAVAEEAFACGLLPFPRVGQS